LKTTTTLGKINVVDYIEVYMSWFGKKEEKELLPDLPDDELPSLPDSASFPKEEITFEHFNPTYQTLPQRDVGNDSIKNGIDSGLTPSLGGSLYEGMEKTPLLEPAMKKSMAIEKPLVSSLSSTKSKVKSDEPVYVRLDKFKITEEAFSEIQTKVSDIEKTLLKLKELRDKEQKELESWEQELQLLKSRLDSIDSHLFESIN